ncbi:MAG: hypothetical protein PHI73_03455 [Patescibacteria group bacterium]|nr:hypothetical protein [Patescibacteria group bacterium]
MEFLGLAKQGLIGSASAAVSLMTFDRQEGASGADTFLVRGVVKAGRLDILNGDVAAYRTLQARLGDRYGEFLPDFRLVNQTDDQGVLFLEVAGERTLEAICLDLCEWLETLPCHHPIIQRRQSQIGNIVGQVIDKLRMIYSLTSRGNQDDQETFFQECLSAFRVNLERAKMTGLNPALDRLQKRFPWFFERWSSSMALKDNVAINVLVSESLDQPRVRFIDPKMALPWSKERLADGNIAVDLAALEASLRRKELEIRKTVGSVFHLGALRRIKRARQLMIEAGIFTPQLYELCCAVYYSAYAACRCDYCLDPERVWLIEAMQEQAGRLISSLAEVAI